MKSAGIDATVVGSGPNGLTAAITLQKAGLNVLLIEGSQTIGGGAKTAELTLPGFLHDICSTIHPLAADSPAFLEMPLAKFGLEWITPPIALAHPFDNGTAAILSKSIETTAENLGSDGPHYQNLLKPIIQNWQNLVTDILAPIRIPNHPLLLAGFARHAIRSAENLALKHFKTDRAKALFAGLAAHSFLPLTKPASASFGLILGALGHINGWPFPKGGAGKITEALARYLQSLGGKIETGRPVSNLRELPKSRLILLNLTPRQLLKIAGEELPRRYRKQLSRFHYGPGVFKIDWALSQPVPFLNPDCQKAATIHIGGGFSEIILSENLPAKGLTSEKPFVLFAQPGRFDPTRAPDGKQTAWAYCHVPHGSATDHTEIIEKQIERFAPGFRDIILARHTINSQELEARNPNCIGGDINGGSQSIKQIFARPTLRWNPYSTPIPNLFICSSSTPPGGGVHGLCGWHAAKSALRSIGIR